MDERTKIIVPADIASRLDRIGRAAVGVGLGCIRAGGMVAAAPLELLGAELEELEERAGDAISAFESFKRSIRRIRNGE